MGRMGWARVCVHPTASLKQQLEAAAGPGAELGSWRLRAESCLRTPRPAASPSPYLPPQTLPL